MTGEDQHMNAVTDIGLESFFSRAFDDARIAKYVEGARLARNTAFERSRMSKDYPRWAAEERAEAAKAWDRVRWYLWKARQIRDNQ